MGRSYLRKCSSLFERETPVKSVNCGKFCNCACCRGGSNDAVFLFPHEKELLTDKGYYFQKTEGNFGYDALLCGGKCERKYRPLGCRIFPLFPLAEKEDGKITVSVIIDPRAKNICPLYDNTKMISKSFVRAVKRAGEFMLMDKELSEYLLRLSEELTDYEQLEKVLKLKNH